jgi:hypothetical protein
VEADGITPRNFRKGAPQIVATPYEPNPHHTTNQGEHGAHDGLTTDDTRDDTRGDARPRGELPRGPGRRVALAAAATGAIVAVGAVVLVAAPTGGPAVRSVKGGRSAPPSSVQAPPTDSPGPVPTQPAASPSANPSPVPTASRARTPAAKTPKPRVRWHGRLTLNGPSSDLDLDAVPPHIDQSGADIYGAFLEPQIAAESDDVRLAVLTSGHHLPTYAQCRDSVAVSGISRTEDLTPGDVVCVKTDRGAIARLEITRGVQTSTNPIVAFILTIWEAQ